MASVTVAGSPSYREARESALAGHRSLVLYRDGIIPGLYGLKLRRGWIPWHPDVEVRLARVDAFFGVTPALVPAP